MCRYIPTFLLIIDSIHELLQFMSISVCFFFIWSAFVSICRHMSVCMSVYVGMVGICRYVCRCMSAWSVYVGMVGICRHMSAFVGLSAYVSLVGICRLWSAYVGICRHMSASVGICRLFGRHMSVYVGICRCRVLGGGLEQYVADGQSTRLLSIWLQFL